MNKRFLQLHILTAYPPSNVNRDDLGRPKTAVVGGTTRLRISSQSLKRSWRTSEVFTNTLEGYIGKRTKALGEEIYIYLLKNGIEENKASDWAKQMIKNFGDVKKVDNKTSDSDNESEQKELTEKKPKKEKKKVQLSQLVHFSPEEEKALYKLADRLIETQEDPTPEEIKTLLKIEIQASDIALFGRMLANNPKFNQEAAAQVSHAITTHKVAVEDDYFTAVDDLNNNEEDRGSSHIGVFEFSSGVFYTYVCINRNLLLNNLQNNKDLAKKTIQSLVEAAATVTPSGKQNSFAAHVRASYVLAELGNQQPRSLALAFHKPITIKNDTDVIEESVKALVETKQNLETTYGKSADLEKSFHVGKDKNNLEDIKQFSVE